MTTRLEWMGATNCVVVPRIEGSTAADGNTVDQPLAVEITVGSDGVVFTAENLEDLLELGKQIIRTANEASAARIY